MPSTAGEILVDIRDALRGTGSFASVTLGGDKDAARWPRAEVVLVSMDQMPPDDRADGRWSALKAKVYIHVRSAEEGLALERALDLVEAAQGALLVDRFRGQRCRDLPIGNGTELGPARLEPHLRPPYLALAFEVRCHFESEGGG